MKEKKVKYTQSQFTTVGDLVITELFIDNEHRARVLLIMTMKEYLNVETTGNNQHCITIYKHKEARVGPNRITYYQLNFLVG